MVKRCLHCGMNFSNCPGATRRITWAVCSPCNERENYAQQTLQKVEFNTPSDYVKVSSKTWEDMTSEERLEVQNEA